jgi:hypothetical protein
MRRNRSIGNGQDGLYVCWRVKHGLFEKNEIRDPIELYGSGGMSMPPEKHAVEAAAVKAMGLQVPPRDRRARAERGGLYCGKRPWHAFSIPASSRRRMGYPIRYTATLIESGIGKRMGTENLELLLFAIQHGALNDRQIEDCLHEWEASGEAIDPLRTIALDKGYLTGQRIRELADGRKKSNGGDSAVRVDVLMDCRDCGAERVLSLDSALQKPVCPRCAVPLTFQKKAERPAVKSYLLPFPAEVHQALEDPKNRFGKYVLLSKLGAGGMGEVFKAWDTLLARAVALKFPRTVGEEEIHRLHIEAQGAGGLSHPNIASVYEIAEVEGRTCIAMQFIEGRTAADKALEHPGTREIVRWMGDAARGTHYAHERGVIHRDIKPLNLMIDTEERVYVMDFGMAKLSASPGGTTVSGMVLGTPAFMPPEQASGSAVDRRSDVYSLGATLYVLLCGQTPYTGETSSDILIQILTTDPPPLRQRDPAIPWELEAIAARAMARTREQRYDTALALADDLDRWLANEPIHAQRATLLYRAGKKLHRHRSLLLAGAACLALAVAPFFLLRPKTDRGPDRFREWSLLLNDLRGPLSVDGFQPQTATRLLSRVDREFPEQKGAVTSLIEEEFRGVTRYLEALPRDRWIEERPRVERHQEWLRFVKKPSAAAERIVNYRGTFSLAIQIPPYADIGGPFVEGLGPLERSTPLLLRDMEIRDGLVELSHPKFGTRTVELSALKNGAEVVIEGDWQEPDSIRVR